MRLLATFLLLASSALAQSSTGGNTTVISSTSGTTASVLGSRAWAPGPQYPDAPIAVPDVTPPDTSGYTPLTFTSAATLASALATASMNCDNGGHTGYWLTAPQGTVITETGVGAVLPVSTCTTDWIVIETAGMTWVRDTRIDPSISVGAMAKLTSSSATGNLISCPSDAPCNNYWIRGLEFEATGTNLIPITFGNPTHTPANLPNKLTFDHIYVHGRVANGLIHGFLYAGNNVAIVDSWISDAHAVANEAQAINPYSGGPTLWQNNFLEGAGEDILTFGSGIGNVMNVYGIPLHDLTERKNWYFKPLQWMRGGTTPLFTGLEWTVKNMHEYKGCVRCLVQYFIMQGNWIAAQNSANILVNQNSANGLPYGLESDIKFEYGKTIGGGAGAFQQLGADASTASDATNRREFRVMFNHIIVDNLTYANCGVGTPDSGCLANTYSSMSIGIWGTTQNHITSPQVKTTSKAVNIAAAGNPLTEPPEGMVYFSNSFVSAGNFGFFTNGGSSNSRSSYDYWWGGTQTPQIRNNAITGMGTVVSPSGACTTWYTGTTCPTDMTGIGFVNWNNGIGGDYRLCTGVNLPAAPCSGASTYLAGGANGCTVNADGTGGPADCGADIATITANIAGVDTVPSLWPDSLSGGGISLSPTSLTCNNSNTVTITPVAGTNGGSLFVQSGLDVMVHGAVITPGASSTTSITITPPTYSGAATVTNTALTTNVATYTATNSLHRGDLVTVTGTSNGSGAFNVTDQPVASVTGTTFTVIIAHANVTSAADSGTASSKLAVTVNNFGLPITASLICN